MPVCCGGSCAGGGGGAALGVTFLALAAAGRGGAFGAGRLTGFPVPWLTTTTEMFWT
ncbi:MAG TPA: hypothetical protein VKI99_07810 [Candidatus Dormibacteraeota bacterium]|nr:hypothetical protein [Candidatus Dormibacteraeota bacterium]